MRNAECQKAQVTFEYFLLLAAIALVTVLTVTTFDEDVRDILQDLFRAAERSIAR